MTQKTQGVKEPNERTSCLFSAVCLCIKFYLSFWSLSILALANSPAIRLQRDHDHCLLYYFTRLSGLQQSQINKLQHVQNSAALLLTATSKYERVTPVLRSLHWLPVSSRVDLKIPLLVFKALNDMGPLYLSELLRPYMPET